MLSFQDVLNNLGSCELDEDDLMLDLEFLEEQNLHPSGKLNKFIVSYNSDPTHLAAAPSLYICKTLAECLGHIILVILRIYMEI